MGLLGWLPSTQNLWGILAELFNVTNYYMIWANNSTGDVHTGLPPETSMLWSLAVEEHFYLIFPAALILMLRRRLNYRRIGYILVFACVLAVGWRLFLEATTQDFYRLYIASDTRFDGLLAGAAMALLWNPALEDRAPLDLSDRAMRYVVSPIAGVVFLAAAFAPDPFRLTVADSAMYLALIPLFWLVIVHPGGVTGRVLNQRWIAHIGVLSFSVYLLHRLVLHLLGGIVSIAPLADLLSLAVTLAAAQLMYVAVEKPLGRLRRRFETRLPGRRAPAQRASA